MVVVTAIAMTNDTMSTDIFKCKMGHEIQLNGRF